jgi:hypothetical protein
VANPVVLHLTRPYANAEEYLEREAWSIETRSMVLIGQPELPPETDVVFDVTLADGSKPIRAEAKVVGPVVPSEGRPGGLRVRFKRYGTATRAFVERAASSRWANEPSPPSAKPASAPPGRTSVRPAPGSVPPPAMPAWDEDKTSRFTRAVALAAPMTHDPSEVTAPADRDTLLERLRKRARDPQGSGS